jgi:predicted restriction endonuclease
MSEYKCQFPFCVYATDNRSKIHKHHIKPREMGGDNKDNNLILLCANCHNKIFISGASKGQHYIKDVNGIEILKRYKSTNGVVLYFRKLKDDKLYFYFYNIKEEFEDI